MSKLITIEQIEDYDLRKRKMGEVKMDCAHEDFTGYLNTIDIQITRKEKNFITDSIMYEVIGATIVPTYGDRLETESKIKDYIFTENGGDLPLRFEFVTVKSLFSVPHSLYFEKDFDLRFTIVKKNLSVTLTTVRDKFNTGLFTDFCSRNGINWSRGGVKVYHNSPFMNPVVREIISNLKVDKV